MWKYKPKINLEVKKSKAEKVAATVSPSVRQHFCGGERVEVQAYIAEREKEKIKMYQRTQAGDTTSTEKHQLVDMGRASLVVPPALLQWRWSDNISVLPGEKKTPSAWTRVQNPAEKLQQRAATDARRAGVLFLCIERLKCCTWQQFLWWLTCPNKEGKTIELTFFCCCLFFKYWIMLIVSAYQYYYTNWEDCSAIQGICLYLVFGWSGSFADCSVSVAAVLLLSRRLSLCL